MDEQEFRSAADVSESRRLWRGTWRSVGLPAALVLLILAGCWFALRPDAHETAIGIVYLDAPPVSPVIDADAEARPGHQAPGFSLKTLQGETIDLDDFHGRWVLVNFWATWCVPCRQEMPDLAEWAAGQPAGGPSVIAVNLSEDRKTVSDFIGEYRLQFPVLLDPAGEAHNAYRVQGAPSTYLVDPDGQVAMVWLGPLTAADFEELTAMTVGAP